ncbi:MAG: 2OG-Fe(II) oxygenase family protein, partial [Pseudomonadota bacterium]
DWGGLLMLIDKQTTDVRSAYIPRFNTLTLFDGMAVHSVSPVSAFAGDGRYSIVGWLRNDPVPT